VITTKSSALIAIRETRFYEAQLKNDSRKTVDYVNIGVPPALPDWERAAVPAEGMTWCTASELVMPAILMAEYNASVLMSMMLLTFS